MRIHRTVRSLVVTLGVLAATSAGAESMTGEVIDLSCYLHHPATSHGSTHRKCAETCAKKGLPIGIVAEDKQVYLLLEDHDNPKAYAKAKDRAADTVTVEGQKVTQGGVQGLVVGDVK
jgi:hypothetical protein